MFVQYELVSWVLTALIAGAQTLQLAWKRRQSGSWPLAIGTVQRSHVRPGYGFGANGYLSVFAYAFPANGSRYAGFFGLEAMNEETAETLQKEVPGTQVSVRYNPDDPDESIVEDEYIRGQKLTQNPHWLP